jgi:hypothetical protein
MTGSILFYIGTAVLALVIAYGIYRWSQFKRTATPADLAIRDQATRENFDKVETDRTGRDMPVEAPTGPATMHPTPLGMAPTPLAPAPPEFEGSAPADAPNPVESPPPTSESWPRPVEPHPGAEPQAASGARRKGAKPKSGPTETRPNS